MYFNIFQKEELLEKNKKLNDELSELIRKNTKRKKQIKELGKDLWKEKIVEEKNNLL